MGEREGGVNIAEVIERWNSRTSALKQSLALSKEAPSGFDATTFDFRFSQAVAETLTELLVCLKEKELP